MTTQEYECWNCEGREYHCILYNDSVANGSIHLGESCLIFRLRNKLMLKRESRRLHLNSPCLEKVGQTRADYPNKNMGTNSQVENSMEEVW